MNPFRQAHLALQAENEEFERRLVEGAQEQSEAPRQP